jgi:hypothetical protein
MLNFNSPLGDRKNWKNRLYWKPIGWDDHPTGRRMDHGQRHTKRLVQALGEFTRLEQHVSTGSSAVSQADLHRPRISGF